MRCLALRDCLCHPRFKRCIEIAQGLLGLLARGDIERGASDTQTASRDIEHASPFCSNPAQNAVFLADGAIIDIVKRALRGVGCGQISCASCFTVIGMQASVEVRHGNRHVGRDPEHGLGLGWPD